MEKVEFNVPPHGKQAYPLKFAGKDAAGREYLADNISLNYDGRRILPIFGEFHYARWERECWEEELCKMKAGGIDGVATYVFWIHHEERKGEWDWTGVRDLRTFIKLCQKVGLKVWLRIGPWCHGEVRHGGFPDYIQYAEYPTRTNSPEYLEDVRRLYGQIAAQIEGLCCKDGGPIIGIQLENEYGHCGGPEDPKERREHIEMLKKIAIEYHMEVPFYSETGWGSASTDETIPVLGGYIDAPWATHDHEMDPSDNFLFNYYRIDPTIAADWNPEGMKQTTINTMRYPSLTCELGSGLQVTSHRRPCAYGIDTESFFTCMVGGGVNMIGYYMYHGGINPDGRYTTLSEAQTIGGYTTLPVKSYDFQAPIDEAGRRNESYGRLKKHHLFISDFAETLAGAEIIYPSSRPETAADLESIRSSLRYNFKTGTGFVFVNNHQRKRAMAAHDAVAIRVNFPDVKNEGTYTQLGLPDGDPLLEACGIDLPVIELPTDAIGWYPFHLQIGRYLLLRTNAKLLCRLGDSVVFYTDDQDPVISFEGETPVCTVLTEAEANRVFRFGDRLYITEYENSCMIEQDGKRVLLSEHPSEKVRIVKADGTSETVTMTTESVTAETGFELTDEARDEAGELLYRDYTVRIGAYDRSRAHKMYLCVDYDGDRAEVYRDGRLIDDWYTTGADWYIRMDRFGDVSEVTIRIFPSDKRIPCSWTDGIYYDLPVTPGCELKHTDAAFEYAMEM